MFIRIVWVFFGCDSRGDYFRSVPWLLTWKRRPSPGVRKSSLGGCDVIYRENPSEIESGVLHAYVSLTNPISEITKQAIKPKKVKTKPTSLQYSRYRLYLIFLYELCLFHVLLVLLSIYQKTKKQKKTFHIIGSVWLFFSDTNTIPARWACG